MYIAYVTIKYTIYRELCYFYIIGRRKIFCCGGWPYVSSVRWPHVVCCVERMSSVAVTSCRLLQWPHVVSCGDLMSSVAVTAYMNLLLKYTMQYDGAGLNGCIYVNGCIYCMSVKRFATFKLKEKSLILMLHSLYWSPGIRVYRSSTYYELRHIRAHIEHTGLRFIPHVSKYSRCYGCKYLRCPPSSRC